jgi:hypothetical protein
MYDTQLFERLDNCSPRIILGRPFLKQLTIDVGLRAVSVDAIAEIEVTPTPNNAWIEFDERSVLARLPLFESAQFMPYRERDRNFSAVDNAIIFSRLKRMVREGKMTEVDRKDCGIVLAPVLVDKLENGTRQFHGMEDETIHSRYRITIDCRPLNGMELILSESGPAWLLRPPSKKKTAANKSQLSGRSVLQSLPLGDVDSKYIQ